jgi:hypothetical protein
MRLEIEHGDGDVRTLTLTRPLTQVDILTYRAQEARWPDAVAVSQPPTEPDEQAAWWESERGAYAALLDRAAVVMPAQLEWLRRVLSSADVDWLETSVTGAVVDQICRQLITTREVPAETAKKFKVRPLS